MEKHCWEIRGCPADMELFCPFARSNAPCELPCRFTYCPPEGSYNPMENIAEAIGLNLEKGGAVKEKCFGCRIYLHYLREKQRNGGGS